MTRVLTQKQIGAGYEYTMDSDTEWDKTYKVQVNWTTGQYTCTCTDYSIRRYPYEELCKHLQEALRKTKNLNAWQVTEYTGKKYGLDRPERKAFLVSFTNGYNRPLKQNNTQRFNDGDTYIIKKRSGKLYLTVPEQLIENEEISQLQINHTVFA